MSDEKANSKNNEQVAPKQDFDRLQDALVLSSNRNTRLLVFFVVALLYLFFTVVSVTDLDLLLPHSVIVLPLLRFEMPLFWFFVVAPVFIVIIHFNLLLNLRQHAEKLTAWERHAESQGVLLPGYFFNFIRLLMSNPRKHRLVAVLLPVIMCVFPLAVVLGVLIRFADYHSLYISVWQAASVVLDCLILKTYWYPIVYPELSGKGRYDLDGAIGIEEAPNLFAAIVRRAIWPHYLFPSYRIVSRWYPALLTGALSLALLYVSTIVLIKLDFFERSGVVAEYLPKLVVTNQAIYRSAPSDAQIHAYIRNGKGEDSAWIEHAEGVDLSGRDLRYADLRRVKFWRVDLRDAKLARVDFRGAVLNGADFGNANLNGANLEHANLNGADLNNAILNTANLRGVNLNGAGLEQANLYGSNMSNAKLKGANLTGAGFTGAHLFETDLRGANLSFARFNGIVLLFTEFDGALLLRTGFVGSHFIGTSVKGAILVAPQVSGAKVYKHQVFDSNYLISRVDTLITDAQLWTRLFEKQKFIADSSRRKLFVRRIQDAMEGLDSNSLASLRLQTDYTGFMAKRTQLACFDSYVAEGMILQSIVVAMRLGNDDLAGMFQRELIKQMVQLCPDTLRVIRNRTEGSRKSYISDAIDEFFKRKESVKAEAEN